MYFDEEKPYAVKAKEILPILVRQASVGQTITYENLAKEVGVSNPRNLNFPLGEVGNALNRLGEEWEEEIPMIQRLVVSKTTGVPGEGFYGFLPNAEEYLKAKPGRQEEIIRGVLEDIFCYGFWYNVLEEMELEPVYFLPEKAQEVAKDLKKKSYAGTGEGQKHLQLKQKIFDHPELVGIKKKIQSKEQEFIFYSKDAIDLLFRTNKEWIGVEIKSSISDAADILRGIFQIIKYSALLEAEQMMCEEEPYARCVLALGGSLPDELLPICNMFSITVFEELE